MPDIDAILSHYNIKIPSQSPGRYYTTCPHCSAKRKPAHQKLKVLGVTITESRDVYFGCNHCHATGPGKGVTDELPHYDYGDNRKTKTDSGRYTWSHRNGKGEWETGAQDLPPETLYRINEARESGGYILVAEGEKDVDNLWNIGFAATCHPHGAGTWNAAHSEQLRSRNIVVLNDNDEPGYAYARRVVRHSIGVAASVRRLDLKDYWSNIGIGEDISDWLDHGNGSEQWLERIIDELPSINGHDDQAAKPQPSTLEPTAPLRINISDWENKPVPDQQWTVQNRFPRGEIALLSGPGAVGKSLIALHLCVSHVLGRDWLGAMSDQGPAIFVEAEDRATVLWRRTEALRRHYGTSFTELHSLGLHLFSLHAQNAIMAIVGKTGIVTGTPLFDFFRSYALDIKPQLIVLPATANIFAGNENDRSQVSQFIHLLGALADDIDGTVLLITHPSLSGNSRGNGNDHFGLSGSTAWHNGPRARAVLSSTKTDDSSGPDDIRKLEFFKNQYGIPEETITLRFTDGMLKPENSGTPYEKAARDAAVDSAFMAAFKRLTASGTTVGADRGSRNHPSALFAQETEIKAARLSKRELIDAVQRLIDKGTLTVVSYGPPSNQHKKLIVP